MSGEKPPQSSLSTSRSARTASSKRLRSTARRARRRVSLRPTSRSYPNVESGQFAVGCVAAHTVEVHGPFRRGEIESCWNAVNRVSRDCHFDESCWATCHGGGPIGFHRSQSSDHGTCADETRTGRKVASISVGGRSRRPHSSPQIKLKLAAQHRLPRFTSRHLASTGQQ